MSRRRILRGGRITNLHGQTSNQAGALGSINWKVVLAIGGALLAVKLASGSQDETVPKKALARQSSHVSEVRQPPEQYWKLIAALEAPLALAALADLLSSDSKPPQLAIRPEDTPEPAWSPNGSTDTAINALTPMPDSRTENQIRIAEVVRSIAASHQYRKLSPAPVQPGNGSKSLWTPPQDAQLVQAIKHPSVVVIIGKRDAGKSALGYRILELLHPRAEPYVVGLPATAQKLLPDYIGTVDRLEDVPRKAVALIDESYRKFHSRSSMESGGRNVGSQINLSRQRGQTLIFIVQEARQLDVNIISQIDVLAIKELSDLSRDFERPELRRFTDKARDAFSTIPGDRRR